VDNYLQTKEKICSTASEDVVLFGIPIFSFVCK